VVESANGRPPTLLVFADDWGRHPSSCQHLVGRLLDRYDVLWVNTIGTRPPRLDRATLARGWEKLRHWTRRAGAAGPQPARLRVLNPKMWPWFGSRFARRLNRELLLRQLAPVVKAVPGPVVAITTLPIVADLIGPLPVARWVYYCVDDLGHWPGLDQATLQQMEGRVIDQADTVVAVSQTLQAKLARRGRAAHLLTHGVECDFWQANGRATAVPQLEGLERPLVVFWGVVDQRMDVRFVHRLAADLTRGTIVLAGPEAAPDPALYEAPRLARIPPLLYRQLPYLAAEAAVFVMPYADLPVTQAIQPLKLKEYLATGKPTVVRDLPATRSWADCLDLADTPAAFARAVQLRLATGLPDEQRAARAERLLGESWAAKARLFERVALTEPMV
jgi:glycosyltransferase involved in cell wall biosynthesis